MTITDAEKIDFLWKKVIYGVSKTAGASTKFGSNETVASPLPSYSGNIWTQADSTSIPTIPPVSDTSTVKLYYGSSRIQMSNDPTSPANQSWLANEINFIPTTFGSSYLVRVFVGDPQTTGTRIYPDTTGYEYVFDYASGVLNFDAGIPAGVSANGVYIQAYQYIGATLDQSLAGSSKTSVVADIAARNALTPNVGDIAHVLDASAIATDARAGEFADYLWTGSAWQVIATAASARTDALTSHININNVSFEDPSINVATVGNGTRVVEVSIEVTVAFDADASVDIGDAGLNTRLLDGSVEVDLQSVGNYVIYPVYQFPADADVAVNAYFTGTPTTGAAKITITWA